MDFSVSYLTSLSPENIVTHFRSSEAGGFPRLVLYCPGSEVFKRGMSTETKEK